MAFCVGSLSASVTADQSGFNAAMNDVRKKGAKTADRISKKFRKVGRKMQSVGKNLTAGLTLPLVAAAGMAIKTAADYEALEMQLSILTGSAEEGAKAFKKLEEFSAGTPFQLKDLVKANNTLIGMGQSTEVAFSNLQMLGDVAAGTGANVNELAITFGQASAEGKLMTRDIREFINRGIPMTKLLADSMGVGKDAIFDLASQGKISFDVLQKAIEDATTGTGLYAGATEKMASTLGGVFSTLRDNVDRALSEIGTSIVETFNLKDVVKGLIENIGQAVDWWKSLSKTMQKTIVIATAVVAAIGPIALAIGTVLVVLPAMIAGFTTLMGLIPTLAGMFAALTGPIALTVAAIAGAAALIYTNWDTLAAYFTTGDGAEMWQTTKRIVTTTMGAVKLAIKTAVTEIKKIWGSIAAYFTTGDGAEFWSSLVETVSTYMKAVWSTIKFYIGVIKALWDTFGDRIISRLSSTWDRIKIITSTVFRVLIDIVTIALDQITNYINLFKGIFTGDWQLIWDSVKNIVITSVNGTISVIESLVTGSMDLLISLLDSLGVGDAIKESLKAGRDSISKFAESLKISKQGIDKNTEAAEAWGAAVKAAGDKAEEAGKKAANAAAGGGKGGASGDVSRGDTNSGAPIKIPTDEAINDIMTIEELMSGVDLNVYDKIFPPGSLGQLQEKSAMIRKEMSYATDPEQIAMYRKELGLTKEQMDAITGSTNKAANAGQRWGATIGDALFQAASGAKDLLSSVKDLIVQFAKQVFIKGITFLLTGGTGGFLKSVFGGIFHEGGIVPGGGDVPIMAKGGEGVFTKGQMAAMGNLQPRQSSSGLSESSLQGAFERALSNKMSRLGPKEVFVLSQQGKRGF